MALARRAPRGALMALAGLVTALVAAMSASGASAAQWLAPVVVAQNRGASPPVAATTPAGDAVLAWAGSGTDPRVWVSIRPAGTASWPAAAPVAAPCTEAGCALSDVSLAVGGDGTIAVAWIRGDGPASGDRHQVTVAVRPAGADAFGAPAALGAPSGELMDVDLAADGGGEVTAVWSTATGAAWSAHTTAGIWGSPVEISGGAVAAAPRLAVGEDGDAVATWTSGAGCLPMAARRRDGSWEPPVSLDPGALVCADVVDARITRSGEALAVWDGRRGVDPVLLSAWAGPDAAAWSAPQAVGISGGFSLLVSSRVSRGPGAGSRLVWLDDQGHALTSARPDGGVWSPPSAVPGIGRVAVSPASAVGGDGTILVATRPEHDRPALATSSTADGRWAAPVPIAPAQGVGDLPFVVADGAGAGVAVWRQDGAVVAADFTTRAGARYVPPPPALGGLRAPARVAAGAVAVVDARARLPAGTTTVQVQRRVGGAWRRYAAVALTPDEFEEGTAHARVRLRSRGAFRLRLVAPGGARSRAVTVRVTRPVRRYVPVGPAPSEIVVGAGGVWVLGHDDGEATLRRLDPASGAVRRTYRLGGAATGIAAGAGAVWVMRGRELLRIDPARGRVTASSRVCGAGVPVAGPAGVWVAGTCAPEESALTRPYGEPVGVAYRIDPVSATTAGDALRIPGESVSGGYSVGGVLWLIAAGETFRDGSSARAFGASTGAPRASTTTALSGTVVPVGAGRVWTAGVRRIEQALPRPRRIARGGGTWTLAPAGGRVWALSSERRRDGTTVRRLTSFTLGGRRGPVRPLGLSPRTGLGPAPAGLAVGSGAVWVLLPHEGAVMRVPLAAAARRRA